MVAKCEIMVYYCLILPCVRVKLTFKEADDIEQIYLTNEVAKILDVSIATIRNYAKSLERAGYEFNTKKQARLWTDKEINLIREVQQFYANNDYPLEQCFEYVVTLHTKGADSADELLNTFTPQYINQSPTSPQMDYLEGIREDTQALITMLSDLQGNIPTKDTLLQLQNDTSERDNLLNEIAQLRNELSELQKERDTYKNELDHVKTLNMFSFSKWKRDNL